MWQSLISRQVQRSQNEAIMNIVCDQRDLDMDVEKSSKDDEIQVSELVVIDRAAETR